MREAETGQAVGAPPPEICGSPARRADPERQTDLQHPRVRLQEQRERHCGQSSALRLFKPAPAGTMPPLHPTVKPNPLQKANLCSRLFFW